MPFDDRLHPIEVTPEQCPQGLRVELLPKLRRARDVAEEHGDDLALFPAVGCLAESSPADRAEREVFSLSRPQLVQIATR